MKKNFHPELHEVTAHCACGAQYKTRSTSSELKVTLCSQCHPYFTGAHKFVDTAGRIEKFQKRYEKGAQIAKDASNAAAAKEAESAPKAKAHKKAK
jgi:large subunit ribosomal protein L31